MRRDEIPAELACMAFCDKRRIAAGTAAEVALAVKSALDSDNRRQILVFDALTSQPIDFDLRGDAAAILARLAPALPKTDAVPQQAGPGRPKLGVVAREVTLLPRHWDWLATQPGGASVTLRKLVEAAKRQQAGGDTRRLAQESTYRFMSAMAGDEIGFEEASRALFADDRPRFEMLIAAWPDDLRQHLLTLATQAFGAVAAEASA